MAICSIFLNESHRVNFVSALISCRQSPQRLTVLLPICRSCQQNSLFQKCFMPTLMASPSDIFRWISSSFISSKKLRLFVNILKAKAKRTTVYRPQNNR